jgi:hypothetical protein
MQGWDGTKGWEVRLRGGGRPLFYNNNNDDDKKESGGVPTSAGVSVCLSVCLYGFV